MSDADCCGTSRFTPTTRRITYLTIVGSLFFTLLMVSPGYAMAGPVPASSGSTGSTSPSSAGPGLTLTHIASGKELASGPFVTNPSTSHPSLAPGTKPIPLAPETPVQFTVGFAPSNVTELAQVLQAQQTPGSPMFQHWLTQGQEMAMFGPNPVEVQNTINYYTAMGFHVGVRSILSVSFVGNASDVNTAFRTTEATVALSNGGSSVMNSEPLSLPAGIASGITTINGLDQSARAHPTSFVDPQIASILGPSPAMLPLATALQNPAYSNISVAFNNSNHAFLWMHFFSKTRNRWFTWQTITPGSLTYIYNATPLLAAGYNGNSTGSPITIAIIMAGGINPDDMRAYGQIVWNNPNNIMSRLTPVPVDGAFTTNGTVTWTDGGSNEMALDIEYSSTMAPGAHIMPVYGPCLCYNVLDDDYGTVWNMARLPNIISNSWGGDEDSSGNLYGPNYQNQETMHYYFMLLDARGATILASSADGGGFDTGTGILAGSYPATDPYVLSIDGIRSAEADNSGSVYPLNTTFGIANISVYTRTNYPNHVAQATHLAYQSYWYEPHSNTTVTTLPPDGSGGFGTSYWFNQSWWQHAPVHSTAGAVTGSGPDLGRALGSGIAAEADFNQTIFFDGQFEFFYGGTSFACPTVAGEFALVEDFLRDHGHSAYLGNGNVPVWWVGNAWDNGNLTLIPYYSVLNGTSFWGNRGVVHGYSWPPGQKFPMDASGNTTYGNSLPGWNFPDGWGTMTVDNFAADLSYLESLPGSFMTVNSGGTAWNTGAWANMVLNATYTIDVNATGVPGTSNPTVTVKFLPSVGTATLLQVPLTVTVTPSGGAGYQFTLSTSGAPFTTPGLLIFELGNVTTRTLGFAYSWVSYPLPPGGSLSISVVEPTGTTVGGFPEFSTVPGVGLFFPPVVISPVCCTPYPNSITVQVTFNGHPVYNALVTAQIASVYSLAWAGSRMQNVTDSYGRPYEKTFNTLSATYTNQTGYAIVQTWNVIKPTTFYLNASYSTATAATTYEVDPGPNVATTDAFGGQYSHFNSVAFLLKYDLRQISTPAAQNLWVPNSVNQSGYYNLIYGWAGEQLPVKVTNYQGNNLSNIKVWVGNLDLGGENKFYRYGFTGGLLGITNTSGTSAYTDYNGNASVYIPDNESGLPFFFQADGSLVQLAWVAASVPGESNRTFSYTEPCAPTLQNVVTQITCQFNNTYQRNYTSTPMLVLPDPVKAWTQTTQQVHRDFFSQGSNISWGINVNLPNNDPFLNCFGCNWGFGVEHVLSAKAFVDGQYAGNLTPWVPPNWQSFQAYGNLTGNYAPGIHVLKVDVMDSLGHNFTVSHTFIVGSVSITNLGAGNTYTVIPYLLNWTLNIPAQQINNHTFNQTLEIKYLRAGCGGTFNPCPVVVNLTERIHDGVPTYNQSLNMTMLNLNHFYQGEDQLPPGQYAITVWLNANHTGSIQETATTFFVFDSVAGAITGPAAGAVVPLGNVTIAYTYTGAYVENATLLVFSASDLSSPVFSVGAFVPGFGSRGSSATWTAVQDGAYQIVLVLGTPYGHVNVTSNVTVSSYGNVVYYNATGGSPLSAVNPALLAAILAVVGGVVGLLIGYLIATRRSSVGAAEGASAAGKGAAGPGQKPQAPTSLECVTCHDRFETEFALQQHRRIVHGIED